MNPLFRPKSTNLRSGLIPKIPIVDLYFRHIKPKHVSRPQSPKSSKLISEDVFNNPIILNLHGLFGNTKMFHPLNKVLERQFPNADIFTLDLRNHGNSPIAKPFDYKTMTNDLNHFIETHITVQPLLKSRQINIIGFSMGGKVALLTTLLYNNLNIQKCISIDLPPYRIDKFDEVFLKNYELVKYIHFKMLIKKNTRNWEETILNLFRNLNNGDEMLSLYFANGFYSNKLNYKMDYGNPFIQFYFPLEEFPNLIENIKDWPINEQDVGLKSNKSVLFMKAKHSPFIKENFDLLGDRFTNFRVEQFDSGHNILIDDFKNASNCIVKYLKE
ncbi:putative hydrolase NDAI_0K02570 [Naumovozyma dairenensis CBS 421]|uniref:AB hydrolase-1 domain-containing protein n=1 Tax=Naumovozyma dairenensis (strain ATCC 10597 / BCRC 20456 / CBS 421 / NBRC 0211 / NRRL Y-12639) TaxID=1071378 RepID=G0WI37_NAUDC|nr:hypothetical protein NDAI_0K02570 [Naumovozyma dairenensis CBS 421]CCD27448.1 hypothetical protein NDAI_0K02570 [Naumovozyma dairenensis CBS 421]